VWQVWLSQTFGMTTRNVLAVPSQFPWAGYNYATTIGIPTRAYGVGDE
jgi:hypothetical protein